MEQEIISPATAPKVDSHAFSPLGCFLAAAGATMMSLCLLGAAAEASVWAVVELMGLPDMVLYAALALALVPVIWASAWTAKRAWHVEQRLARGLDVDTPDFKLRIV